MARNHGVTTAQVVTTPHTNLRSASKAFQIILNRSRVLVQQCIRFILDKGAVLAVGTGRCETSLATRKA